MTRPTAVLASLLAAAALLVGIELGAGALSFGQPATHVACEKRAPYPGDGTDAAIQRIVLDGLESAGCELGVTREELVLSLSPAPTTPIRWDTDTIDRAVKAGLVGAIDDAEQRGDIGGTTAFILRGIAERAPVRRLVEGGSWLADLFG